MSKKTIRAIFRESVFGRDGHRCAICGGSHDLDAHHITNRNEMPNGGYVVGNGITLCVDCHLNAEMAKPGDNVFGAEALYSKIGSSKELAMSQGRQE